MSASAAVRSAPSRAPRAMLRGRVIGSRRSFFMSAVLPEVGLEALDGRNRCRIDGAQDREVERDEVAHEDQREDALDGGGAARLDAVHAAGAALAEDAAGQLDALLDARM